MSNNRIKITVPKPLKDLYLENSGPELRERIQELVVREVLYEHVKEHSEFADLSFEELYDHFVWPEEEEEDEEEEEVGYEYSGGLKGPERDRRYHCTRCDHVVARYAEECENCGIRFEW